MLSHLLGRRVKSEFRGAEFSLANLKDPALLRLFGGGVGSSAGVDVTEQTALSTGAVKQAVRLISETLGMLPLHVYERNGDAANQRRRATNHPLYRVLHDAPNPEQTRVEWMAMMVANHIVRGDAYAEVVRDGGDRVRELWPIPANRVQVIRDPETRERVYIVNLPTGPKKLKPSQILHVPAFQLDGLTGRGLLQDACEAIGTMVAAERSGGALYANGLNPGSVATHPSTMSDTAYERLMANMEEAHNGISKRGRLLLLEEGVEWKQAGLTAQEAELINSRKFGVTEVARHTNLPPHMLMDLERATFSNIEEQSIQFVVYSLGPFIARFEQKFNTALINERESDRYFVEFNVDGLLRGNIKARFETYQIGIQQGILSRNECRDLEGRAPYVGGDVMLQPLNMAPVGSDPTAPPAPAPKGGSAPPQDGESQTRAREELEAEYRAKTAKAGLRERQRLQKSFQRVIADAAGKLVKREAREIKKLADKYLPGGRGKSAGVEERGASSFLDAAEKYYGDDYKQQIAELLGPALAAYADAVAGAVAEERGGDVPDFTDWLDTYMNSLADARAKTKYGQLIDLMKNSDATEFRASVETAVDEYVAVEPDEVGTRESVQMGNALSRVVYAGFGVKAFQWASSANACPICAERDGEIATTNPPLHKGCTCDIVPAE